MTMMTPQPLIVTTPTRGSGKRAARDDCRVDVEFDARTSVTSARYRALVSIPTAELAAFADPQMWRVSPFFPESYKILSGPRGYVRDEVPPKPGTSWNGLLYEHVCWIVGGFELSRFFNVLNIDYEVGPRRITLHYSLHRPLGGHVWFSPGSMGVDVDRGHFIARQTPQGTEIELLKCVRFVKLDGRAGDLSHAHPHSSMLNSWTAAALRFWMKAVMAPWTDQFS